MKVMVITMTEKEVAEAQHQRLQRTIKAVANLVDLTLPCNVRSICPNL